MPEIILFQGWAASDPVPAEVASLAGLLCLPNFFWAKKCLLAKRFRFFIVFLKQYTYQFHLNRMYRNLKPLASLIICAALVSTQAFAQTPKTVKKAPVAVAPAANPLKTALDSVAYAIGLSVGGSLKQQGLSEINTNLLLKAVNETLKEQKTALSPEQANQYIGEYFQKQTSAKGNANLAAGKKFLEENKKRPNVKTTDSGLQYEVIKLGEGPKPTDTSTVKVNYHGTLVDGTVFDSSVERGEPVEFPVNRVIAGWTEALKLMPAGSKFRLFIPADLAYGERATGPKIGPNSTLIFDVELLEIL